MNGMQQLAAFAHGARFERIDHHAREQLKVRLLDTLGVAIAALDADGMDAARRRLDVGVAGATATLIGGGQVPPEQAAAFHTRLARRLDFMDALLTPDGVSHPSDSIAAVLAAAESADAGGTDLLAALAVAYTIHARLGEHMRGSAADAVAVDAGACASAAAVAKVSGFDEARIAAAVSAAGAGRQESGVADGAAATPGSLPGVDWSHASLAGVRRTIVRKFAAAVHAQSAIEAASNLSAPPLFDAAGAQWVRVKTYQVACDRLGGGAGASAVRTPEQARRSLRYAVAVALIDHAVCPESFTSERIARDDVQALLRKVSVAAYAPFTARYPGAMASQIDVQQRDGTVNCTSASSFQGSTLQPLDLVAAAAKFHRLVAPFTDRSLAVQIFECIRGLESHRVRELTALLAKVSLVRW